MRFTSIAIYFINKKDPQTFRNMEFFKEEHGIRIEHNNAFFPNKQKDGRCILFVPYCSILKVDIRLVNNNEEK